MIFLTTKNARKGKTRLPFLQDLIDWEEIMTQTPLTAPGLSSFIEQQAKDAFYYSQVWLDLMSKLYGYRVIPLTTTHTDGQITGFLPVCFIHSPLTGRRLVALP